MSKIYKLDVMEKRTYCHDVIIQVDDDTDIDVICNRIKEVLNNLHGDIRDVNYTPGVKVIDIFKDENPECECKVLDYVEIYSDEAVPVNYLKNLPSIQPKSKEGYWIDKGWSGDWAWQTDGRGNCWRVIVCSECGKKVSTESNYCPNCGARMRKKIND